MPRVPVSDNVIPMQTRPAEGSAPSPTMLAMAAALMHAEGKLGPKLPKDPDDRSNK